MKPSRYAPILLVPMLCATLSASATPYPADGRGYFPTPRAMHQPLPWRHGAPASIPRSAPNPAAPARIIREGLGKLDAFLSSGEAREAGAVEAYLALEIAPYFDLEYMSRWAAGPLYRRLSPEQRVALAKGLGQLFFRNMATHLAGYRGGEISYLPGGNPNRGETTVRVRVGGADRPPVRIDFRMYRSDDGWRVFDVQANGRSAVVHYRNLLANMARQGGLQGMINQVSSR